MTLRLRGDAVRLRLPRSQKVVAAQAGLVLFQDAHNIRLVLFTSSDTINLVDKNKNLKLFMR
jgi:hypothetical protein